MTAKASTTFPCDPYKVLLGSTADCVKILSVEGHILDVNVGALRLMEAERSTDLIGRDWLAFWEGSDRVAAEAAFELALSGHVGRAEGSAPTLNGTILRWDSLLTPVPGPDGSVARICCISRDVTAFHEAARELGLEQRRNAALIRAVSQIVWRSQAEHKISGREEWLHYCGLEHAEEPDFHWFSAVHPEDRSGVQALVDAGVARGEAYEITYRLRHRSGTWRWVQDRAVPIRDDSGNLVEWVGLIVDIDDRVQREAALRTSEERLRLAVQVSHLGIWDRDLGTGVLRRSSECSAMLGLPVDAAPDGTSVAPHIHPDDRSWMARYMDWRQPWDEQDLRITFRIIRHDTGEVRWITSSGRSLVDDAGKAIRRIGTWQDVTETVLAERKLWHAANHDALTGLGNRNLFNGVLEEASQAAARDGAPFALLLLDLDDFKSINDTLGHAVGDIVLKSVAALLRQHCPADATLARLGGDEFVILMPAVATAQTALHHAERLSSSLAQPVPHADGFVRCTASMGVVICPSECCAPTDALRNADLALYEAKKKHTGRHAIFTAGMASALLQRAKSLQLIEDALARDAVVPFYQPKIEIATGRIDGFEALLRWHDGQGWCAPGSIAEAFNHPRLATRLGECMLDAVIADLSVWRAMGLPVGRIAINVSAAEFSTVDVAERLLGRLASAGLTPADVDLEVTESVVLGAQAATVGHALQRLHEEGLSIALDDFGTGYASLTHLRQYPFDWLKIDRSFVSDIESDGDAAAIATTIIGLAHSLGRRVVAEGVEDMKQFDTLRRSGCDVIQGYLVAKPMPAARVPQFVHDWAGLDDGWSKPLPVAS